MGKLRWIPFEGEPLYRAVVTNDEDGQPDERPAIYRWRASFSALLALADEPARFEAALTAWTHRPLGILRPVKPGHYIHIHKARFGGAGLSDDKLITLRRMVRGGSQFRIFLADLLAHLESSTPPLYVGETRNLRTRTQEHITGALAKRLQAEDYHWVDLKLEALYLPASLGDDKAKSYRTLLEMLATRFGVAGFTIREG